MQRWILISWIILASILPRQSWAQNPHLWSLGVTGGGNESAETMFVSGVKDFADAAATFKPSPEHMALFFGTGAEQTYLKNSSVSEQKIRKYRDEFIKNPKGCPNADKIFQYMLGKVASLKKGEGVHSDGRDHLGRTEG